ncbi:MAG TPA: hypothetical protein VFS02_22365 [Telluria sp.]|nr:hypothetical protein [Telluria sp.]
MSNIPNNYVSFCTAVVKLAQAEGFGSLGLTINPGLDDSWTDQVRMNWRQGRHGEESRRLVIESTVIVRQSIDAPDSKP